MSRRRKIARVATRGVRASAALPDSREFLEPLARILIAIGCTPEVLERQFAAICRKLKKPKHPFEPLTSAYVADLSHVIARWHVDERYVDAQGRPNALPLEGPGPSLKELIGKVLPQVDATQAVRALIDLKGVRPQGERYLPTDKYLALNRQPLAVFEHALAAVLGMLRTVEHNVSAPPGKRLLERVAMNPRFPVSALPRLHDSLNAELPEILWKLDQKMFRKELYQRAKRFTRVGIGFYVFEDPQVTGIARGRERRRAQSARGRTPKRSRRR
ncbi:MAG TPA: DUF6502 family protein [Steroidobacteraceae bacterium]|nr:DUF6502 family protein [Steroidobacteraceae bacterium]